MSLSSFQTSTQRTQQEVLLMFTLLENCFHYHSICNWSYWIGVSLIKMSSFDSLSTNISHIKFTEIFKKKTKIDTTTQSLSTRHGKPIHYFNLVYLLCLSEGDKDKPLVMPSGKQKYTYFLGHNHSFIYIPISSLRYN